MPTLLDVTGQTYPDGLRPLDRKSILPLLTGEPHSKKPDPMFFQLKYASVDQKAVIQWPWKAWFDGKEGWFLYRMDLDGAETTDLKEEHPETVE